MEEIKKHIPGTFCWLELGTTDTDAAKKYYGKLFGWQAEDQPSINGAVYTMFLLNDKPVAAVYKLNDEQQQMQIPPHWMSYVSTDNAEQVLQKVQESGGRVIMEAFPVQEFGKLGVFQDIEGAIISVWEPREHIGSSYKNIPGALSWTENACRDLNKTRAFYEKVFGWSSEKKDMGDMEYTVFRIEEEAVAGQYEMPEEMQDIPSHWLPYFLVKNAEETIKAAEEMKSAILMPNTYAEGVGYFAVIQDPQGAVFGIIQGEE